MDNCTVNGEFLNGTNDTPDFQSTAAEFLLYKIGTCDFTVIFVLQTEMFSITLELSIET